MVAGTSRAEPATAGRSGAEQKTTTTVDIMIPVHNERRALPGCVETLHAFLTEQFPFDWSIVVVDNASTDDTLAVAHDLARRYDRVRVHHLERKGRGLALRESWGTSEAAVVGYMDVDLSTGLDALLPLVAPLVNGHSDLAIGSRLAPGSRTVRGLRREFVSRGYNALIRLTHGARFTDAQCGFKAARTEVIRPLLDSAGDEAWFFDTELLLLAEHNGLRVHEVPVDWVEDVDSRVDVVGTALDDIKGLIRVARAKANGTARVSGLPRRPEPRAIHPDAVLSRRKGGLSWQMLLFAVVGVISTLANLALYGLFRTWWPVLGANLAALVITTIFNTEANRRFTFAARDAPRGRTHLQGFVVFVLYFAFTSAALLVLHAISVNPPRVLELAVLLGSSAVGTAGRFFLLRSWVFRRDDRKDQCQ